MFRNAFNHLSCPLISASLVVLSLTILFLAVYGDRHLFNIRSMRILIYGLNFSPELAGIGKYSVEMAQWLARRGHDVSL